MGIQHSRTLACPSPAPPLHAPPSSRPPPWESKRFPIAFLPVEILTVIFHHLPICDLQMVGETCQDLQRAVRHDASLWTHVEVPVQDGRLEQTKEEFLCRLLRQRPRDVHSLSLLGARAVRGDCLMAFGTPLPSAVSSSILSSLSSSPSLGPASPAVSPPSLTSLRELDLSHCPGLQLSLLERALPALRHSLRSLSLRNTDHLLNDDAIAVILSRLALPAPSGTTALISLHLGTSTRRAARPSPPLSDHSMRVIHAACPSLQSLSLHNQTRITDAGLHHLLTPTPLPLSILDLGLCASLSDQSILSLA